MMSATLAQTTQMVAPVVPVIPAMITSSANAMTAAGQPTTNSIFIDQNGDAPTVNMSQVGAGNQAGSAPSPVYLRGAGQSIITVQQGNNNVISNLQVINDASGTNVGASVVIRQVGNSNTVDALCGDITMGCNKANINWMFTGNSNTMYFRGMGQGLISQVNVGGNGNAFNVAMSGAGQTQLIDVAGNNNTFNLSQTSTGAVGSSMVINQTGTGTTYNVQQSGTIDSVLNIHSVANGGSFNILQRN